MRRHQVRAGASFDFSEALQRPVCDNPTFWPTSVGSFVVRARYEQLGEPVALAILVQDHLERPSNETREEIRRAFDEISPVLACNSITILGSGFFSSFFISIVSQTLSLTRRHGGAHRIHTNLESTALWMHEQLNDPNTSVEEVYETLQLAVREDQALRATSSPAPA